MDRAPETLQEVEYDGDNIILRHSQDTSLANYGTQLIKENSDRGFTKGRMFQLAFRIPVLDQIKLVKQHPELHDPNLMEKWVFSHDDCAQYRIADNKRVSAQGLTLIVR